MGKITYGLSNLYYAKVTNTGGVITYATPVAIPGARELTLDVSGEPTIIWADNIQYVTIGANSGYEGSVTALTVPTSFYTDILGMTLDANDVLVESEDDTLAQFALLGEFDTEDTERKRFCLYNCTASKPSFGGSTKEDTVEAYEFEIPITATAAIDTGFIKSSVTNAAESLTEFNGWLTSVYVPNFNAAKLTGITIGSASLTPTFDGDVRHYTASTSAATGAINATAGAGVTTSATLNGAAFTLGNTATWEAGDNEVVIYAAETGKATQEYFVTVTYTA